MPPAKEIAVQAMDSLVKFHVSYLGRFALGFVLPRRTPAALAGQPVVSSSCGSAS
jgi:hypothetical protein